MLHLDCEDAEIPVEDHVVHLPAARHRQHRIGEDVIVAVELEQDLVTPARVLLSAGTSQDEDDGGEAPDAGEPAWRMTMKNASGVGRAAALSCAEWEPSPGTPPNESSFLSSH
jgi:hypothetical protein